MLLRDSNSQGESMKTYEVRPAGCRPTYAGRGQETFSVPIGEVSNGKRRPAAIYRIKGSVIDERQIDALAVRLARWINTRPHADPSPALVPWSNDESARIVLTPAGKKAGFLRP